jgi:hypothetical protein
VASSVPGGREHPFGRPPASFSAVLVVRMNSPSDSMMEYWPYMSAGSEVDTAVHVPTGVAVGVLLVTDADGGLAVGVGATAVAACGVAAGGDDELHAESDAARASTDAGAMNMVSFKSFFPLLILSAVTSLPARSGRAPFFRAIDTRREKAPTSPLPKALTKRTPLTMIGYPPPAKPMAWFHSGVHVLNVPEIEQFSDPAAS